MIVPTRRTVLLLAAAVPLALAPALVDAAAWQPWAAGLAALTAAVVLDAALGRGPRELAVGIEAPPALYVGECDDLTLEIGGGWARPATAHVLCDFDELLRPQPSAPAAIGRTAAAVRLQLSARRRGLAHVEGVWLRWKGPLGLLEWTRHRPVELAIPVLPNVRAVRQAALRFFSSRQFLSGTRVERHIGDGSEFDSLREHQTGLDARAIDWKASARHHKVLGREYRAERNHTVVVAIDTGHLMAEPLPDVPRLDHAINASLLLAYVALKTGDRVGLFAFDDKVRAFAEPQGGVSSFAHLQLRTAALAYSQAETNFTVAFADLGRRLRRRSLVVVLTDFVDSVTAELMLENLDRLSRGHLVVFVALRDEALEAAAGAFPAGLDGLNRAVTAQDLARERDLVLARLRRLGVHCIDARPGEVSAQLVNRYLDVKRRELV